MEKIDRHYFEKAITEVAPFEVELEIDPTQPHLGLKYINESLAKCRNYLNIVQNHMQNLKVYEKKIRISLKTMELDFEFKFKEKLSDDVDVKRLPSIEDRKALVSTMLQKEIEAMNELSVLMIDCQDTFKILKSKYDHLNKTSQDIKMQKSIVKDDMSVRMMGYDGYSKPKTREVKVTKEEILDPNSRPESYPEPIDGVHAAMIADFFNNGPSCDDQLSVDDLL